MNQKVATQPKGQEELIARLKEARERFGYVPREVMEGLAESFGIPINDVYGVASFYSFISAKPLGRNVIRVCKSLPCYFKHSQGVVEAMAKELGIKPGETTSDGRYSLQLTNCIGLCEQAPAMLINSDPHGNLTPEKIGKILKSYQ